jgi:hypothetical protein
MRLSTFTLIGAITMAACGGSGDEPGPLECSDRPACQVDPAATTGQAATLQRFCTREKWPTHPSAGLWPACVVDPGGRLYLLWLGGSQIVEMPGWTHDAYGGPTIDATARGDDLVRCQNAMTAIALLPTPPFCGH